MKRTITLAAVAMATAAPIGNQCVANAAPKAKIIPMFIDSPIDPTPTPGASMPVWFERASVKFVA